MLLLRYYMFQITKLHLSCLILSETFTYDMRERAKRASVQNHRVFSFLRNVRKVTSNVRFISHYTLFFEQYRYHLQVDVRAKISLCGHCLINYFGITLYTF